MISRPCARGGVDKGDGGVVALVFEKSLPFHEGGFTYIFISYPITAGLFTLWRLTPTIQP